MLGAVDDNEARRGAARVVLARIDCEQLSELRRQDPLCGHNTQHNFAALGREVSFYWFKVYNLFSFRNGSLYLSISKPQKSPQHSSRVAVFNTKLPPISIQYYRKVFQKSFLLDQRIYSKGKPTTLFMVSSNQTKYQKNMK